MNSPEITGRTRSTAPLIPFFPGPYQTARREEIIKIPELTDLTGLPYKVPTVSDLTNLPEEVVQGVIHEHYKKRIQEARGSFSRSNVLDENAGLRPGIDYGDYIDFRKVDAEELPTIGERYSLFMGKFATEIAVSAYEIYSRICADGSKLTRDTALAEDVLGVLLDGGCGFEPIRHTTADLNATPPKLLRSIPVDGNGYAVITSKTCVGRILYGGDMSVRVVTRRAGAVSIDSVDTESGARETIEFLQGYRRKLGRTPKLAEARSRLWGIIESENVHAPTVIESIYVTRD